ncbi:MAG TPA: hypothetical protein VI583_14555, partial [Cyclobacteriaceae bacterium]|nr:hypothetical protein [Cyclobacteriaceae bacterium]
ILFACLFREDYKLADKAVTYVKERFRMKSFYFLYNGMLQARQGNRAGALAMCDSLDALSASENIQKSYFALIHAALSDKKKMYEYLNEALQSRESFHFFIKIFPEFVSCKNDPEYQKIAREIWIPRD